MSSFESLIRGSGGNLRRRASRGFFKTSVTSNTPRFPRNYFPAVRDTSAIANALPYLLVGSSVTNKSPMALHRKSLSIYEDRRFWHPDAIAPARSKVENYPKMGEIKPRRATAIDPDTWERINKPSRRIDWRPRVLNQFALQPWKYGFANPSKVIICLKRKIRREIAHALGFAGSSHNKKPKYNFYSHVRC